VPVGVYSGVTLAIPSPPIDPAVATARVRVHERLSSIGVTVAVARRPLPRAARRRPAGMKGVLLPCP
jgi:hypothetical protein